ncbi:MAG: family 16 glycosylhydrolase [Caldilineaceae bacterium]|nr:family 16 glycosylhydrolase [Caldilineaceae bacterium]
MKMPLESPSLDLTDLTDLTEIAYETGGGTVEGQDGTVRLSRRPLDDERYSNAQLDDYHLNGVMRWRPPVRLVVRARFSHSQAALRGTAGFGFWNDPFAMTKIARSSPLPRWRLPQAVWFFFASPPSQMPLALGVPGFGWKAATIDATRPVAKALMPFAPLGALACRLPWLYRGVWPLAQRILKIDEALVPAAMEGWHEYVLEWETDRVRFVVDGEAVFSTHYAPRGPLGFVAWIDNQYMVATPQGRLRHGMVVSEETQWMELVSCRAEHK